jgi:hypothetical protein
VERRYDLDEVIGFGSLRTPSKAVVLKGNELFYKKVVQQGFRVLVPYPLDSDGDWRGLESFPDDDPVASSRDYIGNVVPAVLFNEGLKGWLAIADLLESQEARAVFDPETKGTYILREATPAHKGSFNERSVEHKRSRDPDAGSGNGSERGRSRQRH